MKKILLLLITAVTLHAATPILKIGGNTNDAFTANFWPSNDNAGIAIRGITANAGTNKFGTNLFPGTIPNWSTNSPTNLTANASTNFTVPPPVATNNPATKAYVDAHSGGGSALTNVYDSASGALVTGDLDVGSGAVTLNVGNTGEIYFTGDVDSPGHAFRYTVGDNSLYVGGGIGTDGGVGAAGFNTGAGDFYTGYGGFQTGPYRFDNGGLSGGVPMDSFSSSSGAVNDNGGSGTLTADGFYAVTSSRLAYLGPTPNLLHYNDSDGYILASDVAVSDVENVLGATGPFQPQLIALDVRRGSFKVSFSTGSITNAVTFTAPFPGNTVVTNILFTFECQDAHTTAVVAYPTAATTNGASIILVGARTNRIAYKAELKK